MAAAIRAPLPLPTHRVPCWDPSEDPHYFGHVRFGSRLGRRVTFAPTSRRGVSGKGGDRSLTCLPP